MASPKLNIFTGATLTFTGLTNLNAVELLDATLPPGLVEIIDISHQLTTVALKKVAKAIADYGSATFLLHHWLDYDFWADLGTKARVTLLFGNTASITFTGIYKQYTPQQFTFNEKMVAELEIEISGDTAATPSETVVVVTGTGG